MSVAAAQAFIKAVKATRAEFSKETSEFYKKFIEGKTKPTANDVKALAAIVKEAEDAAKVYHTEVDRAMAGFGGTADTEIGAAKSMLEAIKKKAA